MPPAYELLLLNTSIPQIQAAQSGDTYLCPRELAVVVNSATDAVRITQTGAGNAILVEDSANPDSTPFVVTAAGDVGIGTSSPAYKLEVNGGASDAMSLFNSTNANGAHLRFAASGTVKSFIGGAPGFLSSGTADDLGIRAVGSVLFATNGSSVDMTLDASGNLGLGVTPSAWGSVFKSFDINSTAVSGTTGGTLVESANAYFNGTNWLYKVNGPATRIEINPGTAGVAWWLGASGTAGNQISSFTQAMTLDASGNLAVGTTSPLATQRGLDVSSGGLSFITGADNNASTRTNNAVKTARIGSAHYANAEEPMALVVSDSTSTDNIVYIGGSTSLLNAATTITFFTAANNTTTTGTERARITSGGYFKASDAGTYVNAAGAYHELRQTANNIGLYISSTNASLANECLYITADRNTTNNSFYAIAYFNNGAAAAKFRVADSGDVTNTNGTYGTISDAKMKTDIVDAGSQWSDIKALRFRKFKMKDDPSGLVQLGVVAQEVEQTSPGLVDEHADKDAEGNDLGTTTKSVKTSILLMKAAVALQEAMARIETLEAEVAALKGA